MAEIDIATELSAKLDKTIQHFQSELALLRTGKATVQMLDPVRVEAYGQQLQLNEVARVAAPDPTQLIVTPYDPSILSDIEKGIASSGLNLQPVVNTELIRISVPPLTQERRQEMVKLLNQKAEQARVMLRTIRTDTKKTIENQVGNDGISEDDIKAQLVEMEEVIQKYLDTIETVSKDKEEELLTV